MDNFKVIYKILKILEQSLDLDCPDWATLLSAESLGISQNRWNAIIKMLADAGYVKGVSVIRSIGGDCIKLTSDFGITLKGLEYLNDNSFMKKAADIAKGIVPMMQGL